MSNIISEVEGDVATIKDSIANTKEQIKSEVVQLMKIQPCIKTKKVLENKTTEKVALPEAEAPTFDGSSHWAIYLRKFEAAACASNWTEKDKAVSLVPTLKGPATELLQKVPPDSQNIYDELIKALELQ